MENITPFFGSVLIASLAYPRAGAVLGGVWTVGRALYAWGYTSSGPQGRLFGFLLSSLSQLALGGMAVASAAKFIPW